MAASTNVNIAEHFPKKSQENEHSSDESNNFLFGLSDLAEETMANLPGVIRRDYCSVCLRPVKVCWCPYLPKEPLSINTNVYILQHPYEESRNLRTVPMLVKGLCKDKCHVLKGKKFPQSRHKNLLDILESPNTLMLCPGPDAIDLEAFPVDKQTCYNLVLIDGTWAQAKGIYYQNPLLQIPRKIMINSGGKSKYVIRTQPNDGYLSTLESAAIGLSILENKPQLVDILTKPLVALCDMQLAHGAIPHESKEYRIKNGLWTKRLPKSLLKRRALEQERNSQAKNPIDQTLM